MVAVVVLVLVLVLVPAQGGGSEVSYVFADLLNFTQLQIEPESSRRRQSDGWSGIFVNCGVFFRDKHWQELPAACRPNKTLMFCLAIYTRLLVEHRESEIFDEDDKKTAMIWMRQGFSSCT